MDDDEDVLSGGSDSYLPTEEEEEEESEGGGGGEGGSDDEQVEVIEGESRAGRNHRSKGSSAPTDGDEYWKSKNIDALLR